MSDTPNADAALDLSTDEALALARRLILRHLDTAWLLWEDVPQLNEGAFMRLDDAVVATVADLRRTLDENDRVSGIDSRELLEQAQEKNPTPLT